jgi:hypothetical protein
MSGPKSSSYEIEERARQQRLALDRARGQSRLLVDRAERLHRKVEQARVSYPDVAVDLAVPVPPAEAGLVELERWCDEQRERVGNAEASLVSQLDAHRSQRFAAVLGQAADGESKSKALDGARLLAAQSPPTTSSAAPGEDWRERTARSAAAIIASAEGAPLGDAVEIERLAQAVLDAKNRARADMALLDLEARVSDVALRRRQTDADAARAEELLGELLAYDSDPAVVPHIRQMQEVVAGARPFSVRLERDALAGLSAARHRADDEFVRSALVEAFTDLGYEVGPEFSTIADGATAYLTRADPNWNGYAVRVRAQAGGALRWHLVRTGGESVDVRDRETEIAWCDDLAAAHATVRAKSGVEAHLTERHEPGELPLLWISGEEGDAVERRRRDSRRRGVNTPRRRTLD